MADTKENGVKNPAVNGGEKEGAQEVVPFGKEMRKQFNFEEGHRNLNHGSFGTYPKSVRTAMRGFQDAAEAAPDRFMRYESRAHLSASRTALAALLNATPGCLALVPNATTGVNTVLRNLVYTPRSKILMFATAYGACEKTVLSVCETTPATRIKVEYTYPVPDSFFVEALEAAVERERLAGNKIVVALFDTIASQPGVRMPFEALTAACRRLGVLSLIDGAHCVGQLDLDLGKLDPDFFVSNLHKWLLVPRGCAVFYVAERCLPLMRTSYPTSHGFIPALSPPDSEDEDETTTTTTNPKPKQKPYNPMPPASLLPGETPFTQQFDYVATLDNSPYFCVPASLSFRQRVCGGESAIRTYCTRLVRDAAQMACASFGGTEILDNAEGSMTKDVFMVNVRLPLDAGVVEVDQEKGGPMGVVHWMSRTMVEEYKTFMAVFWYRGCWWVRFSAMVYLDLEDFEWAVETLKELCARVEKGEHLKV